LLAARDVDLLGPGLEQVRVAPEAVMAVRGLVISPFGRHQHPRIAQHIEHGVSPQ